ncbi:methylenetetrahydrofolate reductase (NADPH) [Altererythrobacter atlanticus]|uniref:Methylenetetrahydrofolate reductase n=1 Tax=Croceibacterium atlanticum TaxID=1267766 RepID=A0A0F7KW10_9SPHN|nr:methylenetetrahydrofolate reductase [Croceibacterium atlanticum]AKH43889.1 Methylenetetrahydrofolate reductase [Croceibacterium atlanticum]MBB5733661.1 methylenetetrahydrofolate reductase (NADPH) [Croceibacterium atlanticum]
MSYAAIHPDWEKPRTNMVDGYSLEMTAKEIEGLKEAAPQIRPGTQIAVTFLPGEEMDQRVEAAVQVRELGFEPIVHLSARRIGSEEILDQYLSDITTKAGVKRVFIIAGDPPEPEGPYSDSLQIIETGLLQKHGIQIVGIGGHPEGHPNVSKADLWVWMEKKIAAIREGGMVPLVVTQFAFDDDAIVEWIEEMRQRGIDVPVRLGVPGPAGIKRLLGFAKRCGVGASASVMKKYGISLTNLIGSAGPDKLVDSLDKKLNDAEHGRVRLHFYPFGALKASAEWINTYNNKHS